MYLGKALQLVLQTEQSGGEYVCEGFSGIPVIHPCYIVLTTDGETVSYQKAARLRDLIHEEMHYLDPGAALHPAPCGGVVSDPNRCHAHGAGSCRKLVVLIGEGNAELPLQPSFDDWMKKDDSYSALPIAPKASKDRLKLRPAFSISNAVFYVDNIGETVSAILSAVGLTTDEYRIFISYRRKDTQELADQLFDSLSHAGFDVFLDRFRIAPAVNFQRRLTQELADKSMVLVLESPSFNESEWTRYEIEFAVKHRLGLFALQTPGGRDLHGIGSSSRLCLQPTDYEAGNDILSDSALSRVVNRIRVIHGRKLAWRRSILQQSMRDALALEGLRRQRLGPTGMIHVSTGIPGTGARKEYAICLTPRPPELRDFHDTYLQTKIRGSSCGLVVGPISSQEPTRKQRLHWLGNVSEVPCFDEGRMVDVARAIKGGAI